MSAGMTPQKPMDTTLFDKPVDPRIQTSKARRATLARVVGPSQDLKAGQGNFTLEKQGLAA